MLLQQVKREVVGRRTASTRTWFWSLDGGAIELQLDPPTVAFYHERVLNGADNPLTIESDPDGILPGFDGLVWAGGDEPGD